LFVLKVSDEMVKHSRRLMLPIAESAEPLWSHLIGRLESLPTPSQITVKHHGFMPPPSHTN
jgi:hypothetical protein